MAVKRRDLIKYFEENGYYLLREGKKHSIYTAQQIRKEKTMSDTNKNNLLYFESTSMKGLYETMEKWQKSHHKRLLSTNIQKDKGKFCCIALTNPTEVVICDGYDGTKARVQNGHLQVAAHL
jgi:hypothetical protein